MEVIGFVPVGVIVVAIIVTQFYKNAGFISPKVIDKTIWIPPIVVGIVGAMLLNWGKEWSLIAWDGIAYGAVASAVVLAYKRMGKDIIEVIKSFLSKLFNGDK